MGERGQSPSREQKLRVLKQQIEKEKLRNTGSIVVDLNDLAKGKRPRSRQPAELKRILKQRGGGQFERDMLASELSPNRSNDEDEEPPSF